jgi:hypothetical protein
MWRVRRKVERETAAATEVLDSAEAEAEAETEAAGGGLDELWSEIDRLSAENRVERSAATERRLLRLRHLAGIRLLDDAPLDSQFATPDANLRTGEPLPEFQTGEVTPGALRAAILRDGCMLVRGLVPRADAMHFAERIDNAFAQRTRGSSANGSGLYEEFHPQPRFGEVEARDWIQQGGGLLAVDSPALNFDMIEMFTRAGLPALVAGYLGEPALISVHKTTLRKAEPSVPGAWHQDGKFMGEVRSLNLWLSLSVCGAESPGLDIVPRRLDRFVTTQTDEALLDYAVSQRVAAELAGDKPIVRPLFEPGDALLFDDLFLHKTGSDPSMPKPRFAIENWFFGGSGFPADYAPLAV